MHILYRTKQLLLLAGDIVSLFAGLWVALFLRQGAPPTNTSYLNHAELFSLVFIVWLLVNYIIGLYELGRLAHTTLLVRRYIEAVAISLSLGVTFFYLIPAPFITPKTILLLTAVCGYLISFIWRMAYGVIVPIARLNERILFVGYTPEVATLIDSLQEKHATEFHIVGVIAPLLTEPLPPSITSYTSLDALETLMNEETIHTVIVAPHIKDNTQAIAHLYKLLFQQVRFVNLTSFYESIEGRVPPSTFSDAWFLENLKNTNHPVYNKWRTFTDLGIGIILALITLALFPCIALGIKLTSRGPILYKQKRIGLNGTPFYLYKFRSMYMLAPDGSAEPNGAQFAQKKDKRITPFGKILRKTRIDEFAQVYNLLKRDVTLIGPRPERPSIVQQLCDEMPYYPLRHLVRPGLTGWAVLHQNYTDTLETSLQKLQYDLYYIKHRSVLLDLSIILKTINLLLRAKGQ